MSKKLIFLILVIVVGGLIGSFLGKFIEGAFTEGGAVRDLFATEISAGLKPANLDLRVIELTFGCLVRLNVTAMLGMVVAAFIFKKIF